MQNNRQITTTIIIFLLFVNTLGAQNLLSSLYELDKFPVEMKAQKDFINKVCSDILIYNFIPGGPGNKQFDLKSKNGIKIDFPFNEDFYLTFLDEKTNLIAKAYTVHYTYEFGYDRFYYDFELNESTYSLKSIFDLAFHYYRFEDPDLVNNILSLDYKTFNDYENKRLKFFNDLAENLKINEIPNFEKIVSEGKEDKLTHREIEEEMLYAIYEDVEPEELLSSIFEITINNKKSELERREILDLIFNERDVVEIIEKEVLQPKVNINLYQNGYLHLPQKYIEVDQSELFRINKIAAKVDYKNVVLTIDFVGEDKIQINIKKAIRDGKKIKDINIKSNKVSLEVKNEKILLKIFEFNNYKEDKNPLEITLNTFSNKH